jgi:AraC-like DNA-binding protein
MVDPATRDMTLLDMALASGFSSKSTFNAAFKRVHGMPPSAWRSARPEPPHRQMSSVFKHIGRPGL